jgi:hypothetical protein
MSVDHDFPCRHVFGQTPAGLIGDFKTWAVSETGTKITNTPLDNNSVRTDKTHSQKMAAVRIDNFEFSFSFGQVSQFPVDLPDTFPGTIDG